MIKANELRVGNILNYWIEEENSFSPTVIDWQNIKWISENEEDFNMPHKPIMITEEILLKCGFKEKKYGVYHVGDFSIRLHSYGYKKGMSYLNGISLYTYPMYIHQLQNLYYALTGQELEVSL